MRILITALLLTIPAALFAKDSTGDMQTMMQQMQNVQKCMAAIDQDQLNQLQQRSEQISIEIDALCTQGKKSQAQKKAISFAKEVAKSPTMKQMKKCGDLAQGTFPAMPVTFEQKDFAQNHVCDNR